MKKLFLLLSIFTVFLGLIVLNGCAELDALNSLISYSTGTITHGHFFDFSSGGDTASGDVETISWNPNNSLITGNIWLRDLAGNGPAIKDCGAVSLNSITTVVPSEVVTTNAPAMLLNHSYIIRTDEGNYAKFRVTNSPSDTSASWNVTIEYYYQLGGSTIFLR